MFFFFSFFLDSSFVALFYFLGGRYISRLEGLHPFVSGWIFFALSSMLATGARVLHFRLSARLVLSSLPVFALFRIEQS